MSAEGEEQSPDSYDSRCIFCRISNNQESGSEILHSDEDLVCFRDIRPGAPYHYLVVPKKHIGNCKTLTNEHVPLEYDGSWEEYATEKSCHRFGGYKADQLLERLQANTTTS
ncbi:hypothetical protein AB205_0207290 [Aquarana catesbeiana]|uniref:Adenosine 5'-monophosphoramidase HINT3 n=1 Tax=Aquarana catesbeiana TaxID=8400 RepID=A0A2G9S3L7_AQUCT|nr:hypothetical protein AB205_0207290 [Aquarana catesbeiana]